MTETSKQPKIWYKRKCLWFIVIIVLLIYFCFVPSHTRISPETTFITEPLKTYGRNGCFCCGVVHGWFFISVRQQGQSVSTSM